MDDLAPRPGHRNRCAHQANPMKRCTAIIVIAGVLPLLGCPLGEDATVEHDNVCIDLSPDGESVVFSSADGDLYIFDLARNSVTRLTETEQTESYPSFSPDGKTIVFSASAGDSAPHHIFLMDRSTLRVEQLTDDPETSDILPRFNPDGTRIVFARAYRHRPYSLGGWTWDQWDACEIASDGTEFSRLTNERYSQMYRIIPRTDGSVLYSADVMGMDDAPNAALYSADPTGKPQRVIPKEPECDPDVYAWASDAMLAQDGVTLAFCSDRERSFWYDVCVSRVDNKTKCLVGNKSRYNRYPDFFPDGKRIMFLAGTTFNAGNRAIYSLREVSTDGRTNELASSALFTNPANWVSGQRAEPDD